MSSAFRRKRGRGAPAAGAPPPPAQAPPDPARSAVIVAVAEGRREQAGLAMLDRNDPLKIVLCQTSEASKTWADTLNTVYAWEPRTILVPLSRSESELSTRLAETFSDAAFKCVARRHFSQEQGVAVYDRISRPSSKRADLRGEYLLTMALAALVEYVEGVEGVHMASGVVTITEKATAGHCLMDRATIENLELVANRRTGKQDHGSLFGIFRPSSACGARLLRSTLMSPLTDLPTISARHDSVALIGACPDLAFKLRQMLRQVKVEPLVRMLAFKPKHVTPKVARRAIHGVLRLGDLLRLIPKLAAVVVQLADKADAYGGGGGGGGGASPDGVSDPSLWDTSYSELLRAAADNLQDEVFAGILARIRETLDRGKSEEEHKDQRGRQEQEVFAVKPGRSGALDCARQLHILCLEDIDNLFLTYKSSWQVHGMELKWSKSYGHHLRLAAGAKGDAAQDHRGGGGGGRGSGPGGGGQRGGLPLEFEVTRRTKKYLFGTTKELARLCKRDEEAVEDCYAQTFHELQQLLDTVREHVPSVACLADTVAYLDLLSTFAHLGAKSPGSYVRPRLVESTGASTIVIQRGRHPVTERTCKASFRENDLFLNQATSNFQLVLGPNASGKSTYLRQTALITVLGQAGCNVPAARAQLVICDRIYTRLSTEDNLESNQSTFMLECSEAAYIMGGLSPSSLVLFDEFGRSTSTREALGLSYAVAEFFLYTPALVLFATHFEELATGLSALFSNARVSYLDFSMADDTHIRSYTHQLKYGMPPFHGTDYGIQHAAKCGWDRELLAEARDIRKRMLEGNAEQQNMAAALARTRRHNAAINEVVKRLCVLADAGSSFGRDDDAALKRFVADAVRRLPSKRGLLEYLGEAQASVPRPAGKQAGLQLAGKPNRKQQHQQQLVVAAAAAAGGSADRQAYPAAPVVQVPAAAAAPPEVAPPPAALSPVAPALSVPLAPIVPKVDRKTAAPIDLLLLSDDEGEDDGDLDLDLM